jgi:lipopolysaccharide transport system permease protein
MMKSIVALPERAINEALYLYRDFKNSGVILLYMTKDEIDRRWAGSILGKYWNILFPLLFLGMYALTYIMIFKVRVGGLASYEYTLMIFCGLTPYFAFAETLNTGVGSLIRNTAMLKDTILPVELIPARDALVALWGLLFSMVWLLVGLFLAGRLTVYALYVIPALVLQAMFCMGMVWIVSSAAFLIRDIANIVSLFLLFILFVSPFAYTKEMVPENLRAILYVNPMYYLTELYRQPLFYGQPPGALEFGVFAFASVFIFLLGHFVIRRLKVVISDYV